MKKTYDIIVGGAGIVGSTMALALANQGLSVAIVDERPSINSTELKFDGRAYALSSTTVKMLSVLNVWEQLVKNVTPILDIKVSDGVAGRGAAPFYLHFDHHDLESGPIAYMVEDRFLKGRLIEEIMSNKSISKVFGSKILKQNANEEVIEVELRNNLKIYGKLLVGADGRLSAIGERSGIKRSTFNYQQTGIACAVRHEREHFGEAHQFFMPAGPIAILPLQKKISSIVWTEKKEKADYLMTLSDEDFVQELKTRFGNFRGQIGLKGERYFFPLSLSISKTLISHRVALIGDAAHAFHPIAGQGLNLGMRDIASLTEIVTLARRCGEDFGKYDVLERYSNWRNLDRLTFCGFTHAINKVFSNDLFILRALRGIGMGAINNISPVRRSLMRVASGKGGELPSLMSGRKI